MENQVTNNQSANQFQLEVDGSVAFIDYKIEENRLTLIHTEVPPPLGGKGIGGRLAKAALDFASEKHLKVVPECAFIANYIDKHPEYRKVLQEIDRRWQSRKLQEAGTRISLVVYYSTYGHTFQMAQAVAEGARSIRGTEVRLRRIPELEEARKALCHTGSLSTRPSSGRRISPRSTHDDLRWAHGILWGTPTRYGNMTAQMKQFIDTTGSLWLSGELEDKVTGVFTSTATIHGGQETTILTSMVPLLHLGMIFIGTPYGQNPQILVTDGIGGSPYGPGTLAGRMVPGSRLRRNCRRREISGAGPRGWPSG